MLYSRRERHNGATHLLCICLHCHQKTIIRIFKKIICLSVYEFYCKMIVVREEERLVYQENCSVLYCVSHIRHIRTVFIL